MNNFLTIRAFYLIDNVGLSEIDSIWNELCTYSTSTKNIKQNVPSGYILLARAERVKGENNLNVASLSYIIPSMIGADIIRCSNLKKSSLWAYIFCYCISRVSRVVL